MIVPSDNFQPAFVTAARVLGLEAFAAKFIKTAGILLEEREFFTKEGNAIAWEIPKELEKIGSAIYATISSAGKNALHAIVLEASPEGEWPTRFEVSGPGPRLPLTNHRIEFSIGSKVGGWILMDGEGKSNFVQCGFQNFQLVKGVAFRTWQGFTNFEEFTIPNPLGAVPGTIQLTSIYPNVLVGYNSATTNPRELGIYVRDIDGTPAAGAVTSFSYMLTN